MGARPGRQRTPAADFIDHRPYSPGDDLRYVNWPALARHDTVHVKVGQVRQATRVDLLLDLSRSMAQPLEKGRFALRLAGALGWLSLVAGDRVTLHGFPAAEGSTWGPGTGPGAGIDLLRSVAECSFDATESGLEPAARRVSRNSMAGGLAVVISDLWLADDLERALGHLPPPRWDLLLLHVLGREELDPGFRGPVQVEDAETGELVTLVADDDLVRAYRREVRAWAERLRSVAARRGATYALLPADWPIDRAVLPYLQRRAILGG